MRESEERLEKRKEIVAINSLSKDFCDKMLDKNIIFVKRVEKNYDFWQKIAQCANRHKQDIVYSFVLCVSNHAYL